METVKKSLQKEKSVKNNRKKADTKHIFIIENSSFQKPNTNNSNPVKIISIAWRNAERLNDKTREIMQ